MIRVAVENIASEISSLLVQARNGVEILIEENGKVVARMGPPASSGDMESVVEEFRRLRQGSRLDGLTLKELRDEGRR